MRRNIQYKRRKRLQPRGRSGAQVGSPTATCARQPQKPTPPKQKPCDINKIQIKCKHCGKAGGRENFTEGVFWFSATDNLVHCSYPPPPRHNRPYKKGVFEVTANSKGTYQDEISLTITRADCHDPSDHPSVTIIKPAIMGELPVFCKGKTKIDFLVAYPNNWFRRNLETAKQRSGIDVILGFFYPNPVTYTVLVQSCGYRGPVQGRWGTWIHKISVYPDDLFKLAISIPSFKKTTKLTGGGKHGNQSYRSNENKTDKGWSGESESYRTEDREVRKGDPSQRYRSVYDHTTVQNRRGGLSSEREVFQGPSGKLAYAQTDKELAGTDPFGKAVAKSIKFSHNARDVTTELGFATFVQRILETREAILKVVDVIQTYAAKVPKVGWFASFEYEFLSGSIEFEWGWKEWSKDNTVFAYAKAEAALTLVAGKLTVSLGAEVLGVTARIYGALGGSIAFNGAWELDPDTNGKSGAGLSIAVVGSIEGELGAEGALGDIVSLKGSLKAGIEIKSKIDFHPFKWGFRIDRTKIKATWKVQAFFEIFSKEGEYEFCPNSSRVIVPEWRIM